MAMSWRPLILFLLAFWECRCCVQAQAQQEQPKLRHSHSNDGRQQETTTQQEQDTTPPSSPVKVFILAGQSNMEGHGWVEHLTDLVHEDPRPHSKHPSNKFRDALWNETANAFQVRDNVFLKYHDASGNLTVGYGATTHMIGPELMFGWTLGEFYASKNKNTQTSIYLIKTAWGGRDLAIDFRPPLSGEGSHVDGKGRPVKPSHYGWTYRDMIAEIQEGLDQIGQVVPGYTEDVGYEISGVVWFQGWNDMVSWPKVDEYAFNMANLIRDMQNEFGGPQKLLPWVLGELGQHGLHLKDTDVGHRVRALRLNQESVALQSEFRNHVKYVHTAQFAVMGEGVEEYEKDYHWKGRADCYFNIGQAFGEAMLDLMGVRSDTDTFH